MKTYSKSELSSAFQKLGITRGDALYVSSSLFQLGPMEEIKTKEQLCEAVLQSIMEVIGEEGTLVVPTFTPLIGRSGQPFILEESETGTGIFSEYIRTTQGSIRSLHPINSVAAVGARASEICENVSPHSYSIESPSYRLFKMNAKAVTIGAHRPLSGWVHLLEAMNGVPYIYNKLLDIEVYANGKKVEREFYASVRYLDFDIEYEIVQAENIIAETGVVNFANVGNGKISCVSGHDYFEVGNKILMDNPYVFLKHRPNFRHGEVPFDGATGNREPDRQF